MTKAKYLAQILKCPACSKNGFNPSLDGDKTECSFCGFKINKINSALNFISEKECIDFSIIATDNISANTSNGYIGYPAFDHVVSRGGWVLDCGAGSKKFIHPQLIQTEISAYANIDILAVNQKLPFADDSFDLVLSFDVLEHVNDPFISAKELKRVLKPGGILIADIPFLQAEHGYPHHYFNATRQGFLRLFEGLEVLTHFVPLAGQPVESLRQTMRHYNHHLPEQWRGRFLNLTVQEFIHREYNDWLHDPIVQFLKPEGRWEIASTTHGYLRKPSRELVSISVASDFDASQIGEPDKLFDGIELRAVSEHDSTTLVTNKNTISESEVPLTRKQHLLLAIRHLAQLLPTPIKELLKKLRL